MMSHGLRALWDEPRPAHPPVRVWRDWPLVGVVALGSALEVLLRQDRAWWPILVAVSAVIALSLWWRRTEPLAVVVVAFGTLMAFDVARAVTVDATGLFSIAAVLVLAYALCRWGAGREIIIGLGIIVVWLGITHLADPTTALEVVAGYAFFLCSAALGTAIRFHASGRIRDIEQAKLRQRHEFARDLHDSVGHHVSGIVIQAQAGQALAAAHTERALAVLPTIEGAATRALEEMRAIVGVLRDGAQPSLAPQPGVSDIRQFARTDATPRVDVTMSGMLDDLPPALSIALYRIAQEALTNALRHARGATHVNIEVGADADQVRLTVRDDGFAVPASHAPSGFGLLSMRERVSLLGGTLVAGPCPDRGWVVDATLPARGSATGPLPATQRAT